MRNPNSTRPWQHVLEVLNGYINLAIILSKNKRLHGEAFNFGPGKKNYKVIDVLNKMKMFSSKINWKIDKNKKFFENTLLNLDSTKSNKVIKWKSKLNFTNTIKMTIDWYINFLKNRNRKEKILLKSIEQIKNFENLK